MVLALGMFIGLSLAYMYQEDEDDDIAGGLRYLVLFLYSVGGNECKELYIEDGNYLLLYLVGQVLYNSGIHT